MDTNNLNSPRPGLGVTSVLVGLGAGVLGTLLYATYKQHHFDRMLRKPRKVASQISDSIDDATDQAIDTTSKVARAAHNGITHADKASKHAIEAVRSTLTD